MLKARGAMCSLADKFAWMGGRVGRKRASKHSGVAYSHKLKEVVEGVDHSFCDGVCHMRDDSELEAKNSFCLA